MIDVGSMVSVWPSLLEPIIVALPTGELLALKDKLEIADSEKSSLPSNVIFPN